MQVRLYEGEVVLDFDEERHLYSKKGKNIEGVSNILSRIAKPRLIGWASKTDLRVAKEDLLSRKEVTKDQVEAIFANAEGAHERQRDEAADSGTNMHSIIERYIKTGNLEGVPSEFLAWEAAEVMEFGDSERVVYSKRKKYCGTLDFTVRLKDGSWYVGDLKTSSYIYPTHALQTAAYQQALTEETMQIFEGRIIVRIKKGFEIKIFKDNKKDIRAFNSLLTLHRRLNELERRKHHSA